MNKRKVRDVGTALGPAQALEGGQGIKPYGSSRSFNNLETVSETNKMMKLQKSFYSVQNIYLKSTD